MVEEFEQNFCCRTTKGFYKNGHDGIRLMKWTAYYDNFYENIV